MYKEIMKAIGIELFDIQPMDIVEAVEQGYISHGPTKDINGYAITYPGGYKTWYPKNIVENKFFILDSSNDGSTVKEEDVNKFIDRYTALTIGEKNYSSSC